MHTCRFFVFRPVLSGAFVFFCRAQTELNQVEEAVIHLKRAMDLAERYFGPHHARTGECLVAYANAIMRQGQHKRALRLLKRAVEILQTVTPSEVLMGAWHSLMCVQVELAVRYVGSLFSKSVYLVTQVSDSNDSNEKQWVLQIVLVLHLFASLVLRTRMPHVVMPRTCTNDRNHQDFAGGLAAMERALSAPRAEQPQAASVILLDMANLLVTKKQIESAQPLYGRALPLCQQALVSHQQAVDCQPLVSVVLFFVTFRNPYIS